MKAQNTYTLGSLFDGIGVFPLECERLMGLPCAFFVINNIFNVLSEE